MTATSPPTDGEHRIHFANGSLSGVEHYSGGQESGACEYWYKNGQKKAEGQFEARKFTGMWTWWRENGELLQKLLRQW